MIGQQYRI